MAESVDEIDPEEGPVYNAVFDPLVSTSPLVLRDGEPTSVNFYIGPPNRNNVLPAERRAPNEEITQSTEDIRLIVTMICEFCDGADSVQSVAITYYALRAESEVATFSFNPLRLHANEDASARISFQVLGADGVQYDFIQLLAFVQGDGIKVRPTSTARDERRFEMPPEEPGSDLVLQIYRDGHGDVRLLLIPLLPELQVALGDAHLDEEGRYRAFRTGAPSKEALQMRASNTYLRLWALTNPKEKSLAMLAGAPGGLVDLSRLAAYRYTPEDRDLLLDGLWKLGEALFSDMFIQGEPELRRILGEVNSFESPRGRLNVRIQTKDFYLPWQLLHPPEPMEPRKFWGLRYDLVVDSLEISREGRLGGEMEIPQSGQEVVVARWRGRDDSDELAQAAREQVKTIEGLFGGATQTASNASFLGTLANMAGDVRLIYAYLHAESGSNPRAGDAVVQAYGPRLMFAPDDFVGAIDLGDELRRNLIQGWASPAAVAFPQEPIVILNACETGTGGFRPTTIAHFPGTFLNLGARSVIATDAPVGDSFAYLFGEKLLQEIAAGEPLARSVTDLRLALLKERNNPLGLLYAYYGSPAARVSAEL